MWALYVFEENSTERRKYDVFTSVISAFRKGNDLMKSKACRRYRVEKEEGAANEK